MAFVPDQTMEAPPAGAPILPLSDDPQVAIGSRSLFFWNRILPAWLRTLMGTKLSMLGFVVFIIIVLCAIFAPLITHRAPISFSNPSGLSPSWKYPFGTNDNGEDIFSQTLYGARFTLAVGAMAGIAVTVLAMSPFT